MDRGDAANTLAHAVGRVLRQTPKDRLDELRRKGKALSGRNDALWVELLISASTRRDSSGSERLFQGSADLERLRLSELASLDEPDRAAVIEEVLSEARIRMAPTKAKQLAGNVSRIRELGGPGAAKEALESKRDLDEMLDFLMEFSGVGPKYSRNILMDLHHDRVLDSIAIDSRLDRVWDALDLGAATYEEKEDFFRRAAHDAGLDGWELDRLLYQYTDDVLEALRGPDSIPNLS